MPRKSTAQINIRSNFVRARAAQLSAETGKSITQVVEDAVRAYRPPPPVERPPAPEGYEYKGWMLVQKPTGRTTSIEEILEAIEESRNRPLFHDEENPLD
jgi:hypothetical protein